jgi:hypothetical protein
MFGPDPTIGNSAQARDRTLFDKLSVTPLEIPRPIAPLT